MKTFFLKLNNKSENKSLKRFRVNNFVISGFTLIETLVAVTLFTFVTFVALSSLFQMQALNTKLKITKSIYSNIYFTIDNITNEVKQGSNFESKNYNNSSFPLGQTCDSVNVSAGVDSCIAFDYLNIESLNNSERRGYYLDTTSGAIKKYTGTGSPSSLTSEDLKIETLKFIVEGNDTYSGAFGTGDSRQPSIKVIIKGQTKKEPKIPFFIETFISQRSLTN